MEFKFISSNAWRLITFGMAAAAGFAFIINRARCQPDAQAQNRQVSGWIMIVLSIAIVVGLCVWVFTGFGFVAGFASLVLSIMAGGLLVLLAGRD